MKVALYVRRSTIDLQPDSLAAQEELLRGRAAAQGYQVVAVYSDSASGKYTDKRDAFRRLIEDVKRGPDFQAVLVRDVSRWSRAENTDEAGFYEFICRTNGVQVLYVDETFGPDQSPYTLLMKSMKRAMAAEFSLAKARTVRSSHARVAGQGFWPTGGSPYAMKRVLVDLAGNEVRTLVRGDRKALANQHAKLAPGDPFEVEVVRRMFRSYADGASLTTIAAALAADQVSSSKGSRWTPATVLYALRNEAYAGAVVYRHRDGQKPSQLVDLEERDSERFVRCVNAHPAIVERPLWESVQARLRAVSTRKTPSMLFQELHAARALWEQSDRISEEVVSVSDFRGGYGRPDSEIIGAKHVNAAVEKMIASIGETMLVTPFEDGYLLDHLLHLGIRVSLPHARYGGLRWSFPFTGRETEDLVLGLAFSPPPLVEHVETLVFRPSSKQARYASRPVLDSTAHRGLRQTRFPAVGAPLPPIRNAFRFRGVCAEMRFLEVVKGRPRICLSAVARELGWPAAATRTLYRKLDIRGESLPALTNGRGGKRLTVTCPHCLKKRSLRAKVVLSLKTDVCFECLHRPPTLTKNRFVAVCPDCGKRRLVPPWEAVKLSAGLETPCHACTMEKGRSLGRAVLASRRSS